MKINLPTKSIISSVPVKIEYRKDPKLEDGTPVFGYYDSNKDLIVIDKDLKKDKLKFFLIHEIVEQYNDLYELNLSHQKITKIGIDIANYINNNYEIIKFLLEK